MKLNIRLKMLAGFMAVVVLLVAVSVVSYVNFNSMAESAGGIKQSASLDDAVMKMQIGLLMGMDVESRVLISGYEQGIDREFQDTVDAFDEGEGTIDELGNAQQRTLLEEMVGDHEVFQEAVLGTIGLVREGNLEEAAAYSIEVTDPVITELLGNLADLEEEVEAFGDTALASADSAKSSATMIVIVLSIVSVAVSMAIALYLSTSISNAVQKVGRALADLAERVLPGVAQVSKAVAAGDLTQTANVQVEKVDVKSNDEIGQMTGSFNDMVAQLNAMGGDLNDVIGAQKDKAAVATSPSSPKCCRKRMHWVTPSPRW
jgi:methyl-accepting chemotaxis protein